MKNTLILIALAALMFACKTKKEASTPAASEKEKAFFGAGDLVKNQVDWVGAYTGVTPCADCQGIKVSLQLNRNETYTLRNEYLGKLSEPFVEEGPFEWDAQNPAIITLKAKIDRPIHYLVQDQKLIQLGKNKEIIRSELSDRYILTKEKEKQSLLQGKTWTLVEIYGQKAEKAPEAKTAFLKFTDYRTVNGQGGCNSFFGSYSIEKGNRIQFSGMGSTEMYCEFDSYDDELQKALSEADNYVLGKEGELRLQTGKRAAHAVFENRGN